MNNINKINTFFNTRNLRIGMGLILCVSATAGGYLFYKHTQTQQSAAQPAQDEKISWANLSILPDTIDKLNKFE